MKIVAEVFHLKNGIIRPALYCVGEEGKVVMSVTNTLLDIVSEMWWSQMQELEALFQIAEKGLYVPDNPDLPDWSINDKNIWLSPPDVDRGYILISNENVQNFSEEYGELQLFSMGQFRAAFKFWMEFQELCKLKGKENMVGEKVYGVL
ncbi:hypothetical protein [Pseudomonas gingeri]|jgi:hypothetical protein|uniref:Uncharacterized protein n=1 Tax=Pseudomonas gingeri TaxID=117681 RepID=A0A7Y8BJV9_9PSED|nr:hypothetical protein [Pseudomonas gingeri]NWB46394.1 hypothetical protein [Pseudomonas gingeri]